MKKRYSVTLLLGCIMSIQTVWAQSPSWAKKTAKSVFTLKTFDQQGALIGSATGFFTDERGTAVSCFSPFKGADRGIVIDAQGHEYDVDCILGANETYDVARFRVDSKKTMPLTLATAASTVGSKVWLQVYSSGKNPTTEGTIRQKESFKAGYDYFTVAMTMPPTAVGAPLLNEEGAAIGLMQRPYKDGDTLSYAVSAIFADSLAISGLSINDPVLRSTSIRKALPEQIDQALLSLYLGGKTLDSLSYVALVEQFVKQFPEAPDGYIYRAELLTAAQQFDEAAKDMEQAIKVAQKKDEAHLSYSKLIYQKEIQMSQLPYPAWTLDKALQEADEAYAINPQPIYRHQRAIILYAQKKYDEAYDVYTTLFQTPLRAASLFYEASRCKTMLNDSAAVLSLLDSCVACYDKPYLKEAAPYLFARADARAECKRFREAVADYNEYEQLMSTTVNDRFYYLRHQAEVGGRLFQQALNDIDRAIDMAPQNGLYYAEKASLQVRVGQFDGAIETASKCIEISPEYSDGYLFLGLAQCMKGLKAEGVKNLRKAKELGDEQADDLIEKYGK